MVTVVGGIDCVVVVVGDGGGGVREAANARRIPSQQHRLIQQVTDKPTHQFFLQ